MGRYNKQLLDEVMERDNITMESIPDNLSSLVRLDFICKCGKPGNKVFRMMLKNGSKCKECMLNQQQTKSKESCLKTYGTEYSTQNKDIQEKIKKTFSEFSQERKENIKNKKINTCLKIYGTEYSTQNKDIQEKICLTSIKLYGVKRASQLDKYKKMAENTSLERYGVRYASQLKNIQLNAQNTCINRYGVKNAIQLEKFKNKRELTSFKRYGVKNAIQLEKFKNKRELTSFKRYGVKNAIQLEKFKNKRIKNCLEKYRVEHPFQLESVKNKTIQTCLKRYGVEHIAQAKFAINCFKFKKYTYPCGLVVSVQGYEHFALNDLITEGYTSSDIVTCRSKVPDIWYSDNNGKKHRYFVDIYLPNLNKMIEVKSDYTFNKHLENVLLKANECVNQGYLYEIWIYDYKGNKIIKTF
jgi:hypothetical protein